MALTAPVSPYVVPAAFGAGPTVATDPGGPKANEVKDKGVSFVHTQTKSTINKPTVYTETDICGSVSKKKGQISANINQLVNCEVVTLFSGSINVTAPVNATWAEVDAFLDRIKTDLSVAFASNAPSA